MHLPAALPLRTIGLVVLAPGLVLIGASWWAACAYIWAVTFSPMFAALLMIAFIIGLGLTLLGASTMARTWWRRRGCRSSE
jgi:hypothetical protein